MALSGKIIDEIVTRIVEVARPTRIILFGSHARGDADPGSDIDLLVVVEETESRRRLMARLYEEIAIYHIPVEVAVVTEGDISEHKEITGGLIYQAVREGREIYAG